MTAAELKMRIRTILLLEQAGKYTRDQALKEIEALILID